MSDLGKGPGGFYVPKYSDDARLALNMMCLGHHWDPNTGAYHALRELDGSTPPDIPPSVKQLAMDGLDAASAAATVLSLQAARKSLANNTGTAQSEFSRGTPERGQALLGQPQPDGVAAVKHAQGRRARRLQITAIAQPRVSSRNLPCVTCMCPTVAKARILCQHRSTSLDCVGRLSLFHHLASSVDPQKHRRVHPGV